jgi:hypothetical protein
MKRLPVAALLGLFTLALGSSCGQTEAASSAPARLTLELESARALPAVEALAIEAAAAPGVPRRRFTLPRPASAGVPGPTPLALALPPGRYTQLELTLAAEAGGALTLALEPPLELRPGEERALVLALTWPGDADAAPQARILDPVAAGSLAGALLAAAGQPLDGARVLALAAGERDPAEARAATVTDERGRFLLRGLQPGTYDLVAQRGSLRGAALQVALAAGETRDLVLELAE